MQKYRVKLIEKMKKVFIRLVKYFRNEEDFLLIIEDDLYYSIISITNGI